MPDLEELLSKFDPERQERLRQLIARRKQFTPQQLNPEAEYGVRPTDESAFWGQVNQATLPARQTNPNIAWQSHVQPTPQMEDFALSWNPATMQRAGLVPPGSSPMFADVYSKQAREAQTLGFPAVKGYGQAPATTQEKLETGAMTGFALMTGGGLGKVASSLIELGAGSIFQKGIMENADKSPEWQTALGTVFNALIIGHGLTSALSMISPELRVSVGTAAQKYFKEFRTSERGSMGYPPPENPYLKMPIERVRKDAEIGVNLAKEALAAREGTAIPKPSKPIGKVPEAKATPELPVTEIKPPVAQPSALKPIVEEVPPVEPQRIPLWQKAGIGKEPPPPPEPPTPTPSGGFPSGRQPGGIGKQTPYTPPDPVEQLVDALTPAKITVRDRVTNFIEGTQRKFYDNLYVGLNELEKRTGVPAYTMARLTRGAVAAGEDNIRRFIRPILDTVSKYIDSLEQYMVLHRNMDIIGRNPSARLPGNMTAGGTIKVMESMKTRLGAENFAKVDQAARELWKKNDELILTRLKNAGMLDDGAYTRIKSANPHYIDFGRADFDIDDVARIIKNPEASVTGTGMQRLTEGGSIRKLDEPLASSLRQYANVEVLVSRNEAAKNIVLGLQKLEKQTGEKLVTLLEEGAKAEHSLITDTISFLQDGKKLTYQVPRTYAISAKGLEAEAANAFSRVAQIASAPLRHGAVTYNPAFVLINPLRDALSAWFREGLIPLSPSYIRGWQAAIMKNADFTEVAKARVLMSGIVDTMRSTKAITAQAGRGALSVKNWKDALTILPRLVAEANLMGERATRIATYYKLRGKGIPELERALRSRDVTVDFAKMGDVMKLINQAIPFTNAGLQGTLNIARTIREKPLWAIAAASPFAITSILAWVNNKRFETSSKIPAYEQSYNWVLQVGEGVENPDPKQPFKAPEKFPIYIKVPKGPMGSALTAPVELLLRLAWATNNRSVLEELLQSGRGLATAVLPIEPSISGVLPPLFSTAVGLQTGQDVFRGQPIVPFREEQRLPEQQFGADTSTLAVELGKKFKVSPRLIDFAIKDYTAGTGQMGLWIVGMALEALGAKSEVYGEAFVKEPSAAQAQAKVPLISRFIGTKATGEEIFDRKAFRDIAEASQRNIAKFPDINRLGITFGEVGDTIAGAMLDIKQRTQYQTVAGQRAEQELFTLFNSPSYSKLSDTGKRQAIQSSLDVAREKAREQIAPTLGVASFTRYKIVQHGGSIKQFEETSGLKWDDPRAEAIIRTADKYLTPYWQVESDVWNQTGAIPGTNVQYKVLSDAWEKLAEKDSKKARDLMFASPYGPAILDARREILLRKRDMRLNTPMLESMLKLFY